MNTGKYYKNIIDYRYLIPIRGTTWLVTYGHANVHFRNMIFL